MFNFGNANDNQKLAITTTDGPVLITAGPGTGKTFTLVQRTLYLIQEKNIKPEEIFIATFTEKAAKELITRITNSLAKNNIIANVNEMYIGTFHSLCLRIIKEYIEYSNLRKNYRILDQFDQEYTIFQNIYKFKSIPGIDNLFPKGQWKRSQEICSYVNSLQEELVDENQLIEDLDFETRTLGYVLKVYKELLNAMNCVDFSSIQTEAFTLLKNNNSILEKCKAKFKYLMIDEYQDTNYIQEQIIFLLANQEKNICVVGDDDQGLYRFRGATIRNILEFPKKFDDKCAIIPLNINYRSNSDIVDFYNEWMNTTSGSNFKFDWDKYRYQKNIIPHEKTNIKSKSVIKINGENDIDEWHEKILSFIVNLKKTSVLTDYNQIAFLFSSVKHEKVLGLARFLENNGINVYSPRSDMFFERYEIKLTLGCLMLLFPRYIMGLENDNYLFLTQEHITYYRNCIKEANDFLTKQENRDFLKWIRHHGKIHVNLQESTDYSFAGILYQMFEFEPFISILNIDTNEGNHDVRPLRNLSLLTQLIGKYEYLHHVDILTPKNIYSATEKLFNLFIKLLYDGGINEYEDDSEYAPSGCVSFLTIHQSKGMEFPIVFVDSLFNVPRKNNKELLLKIENKYYNRPSYEPTDNIKYYDFWRLYYTAFSRAQNILILTCNEDSRTPSNYFKDIYETLKSPEQGNFNPLDFKLQTIKTVNIKSSFSFTSHINVYETCSLQYKFYKELEFMPVKAGAMIFGRLVHETIEDVHKSVLRGESDKINEKNVKEWFDTNYQTISKNEHTYLAPHIQNAAFQQIMRYVNNQDGKWSNIQQAEVDVSLVKDDYIIDGKIDLIKGYDDTVEIVDFKSEKKPDLIKGAERIEQYKKQLYIYARLVEERTGKKVSKMHLYYTAEENSVPTISFPYRQSTANDTMSSFDNVVHKILAKNYSTCANDIHICKNCDFRYYCNKR